MPFESFGTQHLAATLFFFGVLAISIYVGLNLQSFRKKLSLAVLMSLLAWVVMTIADVQKMKEGTYTVQEDLPLYMCRLVAWLLPFALILKKWSFIRILYFWVLAGTLQAVLTPDLEESYPDFLFFRYFILHFGLIATMIYTIVVFKIRITWRDFFRAFLFAQVYLVFLMLVNHVLGSNYGYTCQKPPGGSVLDLFGDWPYYLLGAELLLIVLFSLLMIPFLFIKKQG